MKTHLLLSAIVLTLLFAGCTPEETSDLKNKVIIGTIDSLRSGVLEEMRKIWIYVPTVSENSVQKFPVIYLLDGDVNFSSMLGIVQHLSETNGNIPQMIIVGIPNTDRTRDLTPTHVSSDDTLDSSFLKTSGGGENFTRFIENELIPYVDSIYPAAPYRTIIGHSYGGLFVINTLINHTSLFNAYISIDPSMWWDNQKLLNQVNDVVKQKDFGGRALCIGIANTMTPGLDTSKVRSDTSTYTRHIRSIIQLNDILRKSSAKNLRYNWKYYDNEDHGSIPLMAGYDALRFVFDYFKMQVVYSDTTLNIESLVRSHTQLVSEKLGYNYTIPEVTLYSVGLNYIALKMYDKAYRILKMLIDYYPDSSFAYFAMGQFLMSRGDTSSSVDYYEKSLMMDPQNEVSKLMLMQIKANSGKLKN